ncbi:hypothetical protein [Paenibacillus bouchesdurhonensis]|uniref:hypothetical protein n=1 Tax=Paenibacillus bouchesdurhonensis TaxID=1870990 RepID=UPI000DA628D2|nr:hypothetical protein [Paenibacillus bouchesdurhonensis]
MNYYILSLKWSEGKGEYVWWRPDNSGYTNNLNQAGIYSEETIKAMPHYYKNTSTYPIPVETVEKMIISKVVPTLDDNWSLMGIDLGALQHY